MTRKDAQKLLAVMAVAYTHEVDEAEAQLWFDACLAHVDTRVANRAVLRIVTEDKFWPTPARFNEMRRAIQAADEPQPALETGPRTVAEEANSRRWLAECRNLLVAWRENPPEWARKGRSPQVKPPRDLSALDDARTYRQSQPRP